MSKVISMFYELKDANSKELLESNMGQNEISFITKKGHIIQALENEILSLNEGESKVIVIKAKDAAGEYDQSALQELPKEQFAGIDLKVGMELFGEGEDGNTVRVVVKDIGEESVIIDFNHPYAGRDLEFNVTITEVRDASEDEILSGVVAGKHTCGCGSGGHHHDHEHHGSGGCCGGGGHGNGGCCGGHH